MHVRRPALDRAPSLTRPPLHHGDILYQRKGIAAVKAIAAEVPEVLIGVGTILTPAQATEVKEAGAHFGVSPGLNVNVVKQAQAVG